MGHPTKIATCCYCGARAALVLDRQRHELACSGCGAPLHDLKMLPTRPVVRETAPVRPAHGVKSSARPASPQRVQPLPKPSKPIKARKSPKKRKIRWRDLAEDVFEFVEDIFD